MSTQLSTYCTSLIDQCVNLPAGLGNTFAFIACVDGEIVSEHYQGVLPGSERIVSAEVPLLSWSMAKSVVQTLIGMAHDDGFLNIESPLLHPKWPVGDARQAITIRHLLQMSSGLKWREEYSTAEGSDVIEMLFGGGRSDMAGFAADKSLTCPPGSTMEYSSGTTNILCFALERALNERGSNISTYLAERLLAPLGITIDPAQDMKFDDSGLWVGSSFLYLTALDWLKYGLLYLNNGVHEGQRVLDPRWVTEARTPAVAPSPDEYGYSNHWWLWPTASATPDAYACLGYEGQHVIVVPSKRMVIVRLGSTPDDTKHLVRSMLHRIIEAL